MSQNSASTGGGERRRRHYVDHVLQGRLLLVLVIFELVLFAVAMVVLHHNLAQAIEQQIYRAHQVPTENLPMLLKELLWLLPWVVGANLLVVLLVHRLWCGTIGRIAGNLQRLFRAVSALDLRGAGQQEGSHAVLTCAQDWMSYERQRCRALQQLGTQLDAGYPPEQLQQILARLRETLRAQPRK